MKFDNSKRMAKLGELMKQSSSKDDKKRRLEKRLSRQKSNGSGRSLGTNSIGTASSFHSTNTSRSGRSANTSSSSASKKSLASVPNVKDIMQLLQFWQLFCADEPSKSLQLLGECVLRQLVKIYPNLSQPLDLASKQRSSDLATLIGESIDTIVTLMGPAIEDFDDLSDQWVEQGLEGFVVARVLPDALREATDTLKLPMPENTNLVWERTVGNVLKQWSCNAAQ